MGKKWPSEVKEILGIGISLDVIGVNNWALSKEQALIALEKLFSIGVPILGGDVYTISNGEINSQYDNWYCERLQDETSMEFVNRSFVSANRYVQNYNSENIDSIYFVIVPGF
jgi:hypothetical protein